MKTIEQFARRMIGDGKLPNKYFVSISNDYMYIQDGNTIDWIGEILKNFKSHGGTIQMFHTWAEALDFAESFELGDNHEGVIVNRITIEDRLSGELYRRTKVFNPEKGDTQEETFSDTSFTRKKLGASFK